MVAVEGSSSSEELRTRISAGKPTDKDHDLWAQYLELRSRFELKFAASDGRVLNSAS